MTGKLGRFFIRAQRVLAIFCLEGVDVDGSVRGLGRDVFVQGIPSDTLDVMAMLGNLSNEGSCVIKSAGEGKPRW